MKFVYVILAAASVTVSIPLVVWDEGSSEQLAPPVPRPSSKTSLGVPLQGPAQTLTEVNEQAASAVEAPTGSAVVKPAVPDNAAAPVKVDSADRAAGKTPPLPRKVASIRQRTAEHAQMITPGNFEYLGAFRPPLTDRAGKRFTWGGTAVSWRPPRAGFSSVLNPGTLYLVGHDHDQLVAELTIPEPVVSSRKRLDDLPVAQVVQPLTDITAGVLDALTNGSTEPFKLGGLQVDGNRLYWTMYKYYNVSGEDYLSHGSSSLDLSDPDVKGLWHLGPRNSGQQRWHSYKHAGYMCRIPQSLANEVLGGRRLMSGLQISTGRMYSSQGPALFAFPAPDESTLSGGYLNALPLLWYPMDREAPGHHPMDRWMGAAWLVLGNRHSVIFVGRKAHGEVYYGEPRPSDCYPDKGYHGDSYEVQMLFYAPGNLIQASRRGLPHSNPWYRWNSTTPGGSIDRFMYQKCGRDVGGVAYDPERNVVYLVEVNGGTVRENRYDPVPIIHVFRIRTWQQEL